MEEKGNKNRLRLVFFVEARKENPSEEDLEEARLSGSDPHKEFLVLTHQNCQYTLNGNGGDVLVRTGNEEEYRITVDLPMNGCWSIRDYCINCSGCVCRVLKEWFDTLNRYYLIQGRKGKVVVLSSPDSDVDTRICILEPKQFLGLSLPVSEGKTVLWSRDFFHRNVRERPHTNGEGLWMKSEHFWLVSRGFDLLTVFKINLNPIVPDPRFFVES